MKKPWWLLLSLMLLASCHPAYADGKSEKEQFCGSLAKIAAVAAQQMQQPNVSPEQVRKGFQEKVAKITDEVTREWIMAAVEFGIFMSPHYPPMEIARYQYYGCWTTV